MIKKNGNGDIQFDGIGALNFMIQLAGFILAVTLFFFTVIQPQIAKIAVNEVRIANIEKVVLSHEADIKRLLKSDAKREGRDEAIHP